LTNYPNIFGQKKMRAGVGVNLFMYLSIVFLGIRQCYACVAGHTREKVIVQRMILFGGEMVRWK